MSPLTLRFAMKFPSLRLAPVDCLRAAAGTSASGKIRDEVPQIRQCHRLRSVLTRGFPGRSLRLTNVSAEWQS